MGNLDIKNIIRYPFYFTHKSDTMFAVLHRQDQVDTLSNTALIICPPLGIEYMNSNRSLRHLADNLALQGTDCLRLDYLNTGSSSDRVSSYNDVTNSINSIESAYLYLSEVMGYKKISILGLRFGATLAAIAAEKLKFDYLILWAPIIQGRKLLREIRVIQKTNAIMDSQGESLEAGGWVINKQTQEAIQNIDLNNTLPQTDNILILSTENPSKLDSLTDRWKAKNKTITFREATGVTEMLVDAHDTVVPDHTIEAINLWVTQQKDKSSHVSNDLKVIPDTSAQLECIDILTGAPFQIKESLHYIHGEIDQFYVKSTSLDDVDKKLPTVILLNSGSNHQVGPHRLYVTICRMLAREGFTCIRLDLPGLGESPPLDREPENSPYMVKPSESIKACIDSLPQTNNGYVLMGLCSGAYHAFLSAIELHKTPIIESLLINPLTFYWEQGMVLEDAVSVNYGEWSWYKQAIKNTTKWKKLLTGQTPIKPIIHSVIKRIYTVFKAKLSFLNRINDRSMNDEITPDVTRSLDKISQRGTYVTLLFSRNDPGENILFTNAAHKVKHLQQLQKLEIKFIEQADHTFSKSVPRRKMLESIYRHFISRYTPTPEK